MEAVFAPPAHRKLEVVEIAEGGAGTADIAVPILPVFVDFRVVPGNPNVAGPGDVSGGSIADLFVVFCDESEIGEKQLGYFSLEIADIRVVGRILVRIVDVAFEIERVPVERFVGLESRKAAVVLVVAKGAAQLVD